MAKQKSSGIWARKDGSITIDFRYKGIRFREATGLTVSKENMKAAELMRAEIVTAIKRDQLNGTNHFNFLDYFPKSKKYRQLFSEDQAAKPDTTFKEYAEKYRKRILERIESGELKFSSLKSYKTALKRLETSKLFNMRLRDIKKSHIEDYKTQLLKTLSPKSVNNLLTPMRQILEMAFEDEVIDSNPADRVKNPKFPRPEMHPFSLEEMKKILAYFEEKHPEHVAFIAFLFFTGCRIGEALAAKWENLTESGNEWAYHIKESRTEGRIGTPKTLEGNRIVPIMKPLQKYLKKQKAISYMRSDFMFINPRTGEPYHKNAHIINGIWKPALKKLRIAYRDMKQLRHTHASITMSLNDSIHDIAKRLGHSDTGVTTRTYAKYMSDYTKPSKLETFDDILTNEANEAT